MDRRGFFKLFGAGVAGIALERAIPFGRVWSFPSNIAAPKYFLGLDLALGADFTAVHWYTVEEICRLNRDIVFAKLQAEIRARSFDQDLVLVEGY